MDKHKNSGKPLGPMHPCQHNALAKSNANYFHRKRFHHRRGVEVVMDDGPKHGRLVAYFTNHPYEHDPTAQQRETDRIAQRLEGAGYKLNGRSRCDDDYSEVVLMFVPYDDDESLDVIASIVRQEVQRTSQELTR